jgi:RING-variant domain
MHRRVVMPAPASLDWSLVGRFAAFAALGLWWSRRPGPSPGALASLCDEAETPTSDDDQRTCRFCLAVGETKNSGPLLSPCGCRGSSEFVHSGCLQHWQRASLVRSGTFEDTCRVCMRRYQSSNGSPRQSLKTRLHDWFNWEAADRRQAYRCAYARIICNTILPLGEPRLQRWQDVALLFAAVEGRILGSRELRRGRRAVVVLHSAAMCSDAVETGALMCWLSALCLGSVGDAFGAAHDALMTADARHTRAAALLLAPPARLLRAVSGLLLLPVKLMLINGEPVHRLTNLAQRFPAFRL